MNEKSKICFFSGDITRSGGTERVSTVIANALVKKYDILFISLFEKKRETFFVLNPQIQRFQLYDKEVHGRSHFVGYIKRLHKFIKDKGVDVLIDIDGILDMYSILAVKRTKTKLISWEQFNYFQNPAVSYRKLTRRWAARSADAIVVLTKEDQRYYEENLNIKNRIVQIYNPIVINTQTFPCDVDNKTIISVGRLTEQKGFDMLIDVAKYVLTKHPEWKWMIVGDGEDGEKLEEKIKIYALQDKLQIYKSVKNVDEYYEQASIYVMTSRYEGFGLVLTEAKAHHLPCVSFRCPTGPAEIIKDSVNGYLVECFDIDVMAEKICNLIEDDDLRLDFAKKSLLDTEKFALATICEQWIKLIDELVKEKE